MTRTLDGPVDSLTLPPVSDVLTALYAEAHHGGPAEGPKGLQTGRGGPAPGTEHLTSRERFARARHRYMAVTPSVGRLLYQLARLHHATAVVEFGTSFGISTLHLGAAVKDNGGGMVIGTEYEDNKVAASRGSVAAAGLEGIVEVREGDATETLARGLPARVDLLFLDGAKELYGDVLAMLEPRMGVGALVVADNAARATGFLERLEDDPRWVPTFLAGEDLVIALRTA